MGGGGVEGVVLGYGAFRERLEGDYDYFFFRYTNSLLE